MMEFSEQAKFFTEKGFKVNHNKTQILLQKDNSVYLATKLPDGNLLLTFEDKGI